MSRIRFEDTTPINKVNLDKLNNVVISSTEPTTGEEVWIQKGKNLVNNIINGWGLYSVDGSITESDDWFVTDFIEVKPNTNYTSSGFSSNFKCFYDENYNFISGIRETTATTPSNAKYMRMNGQIAMSSAMEIEEGSTIIPKKIHTKNDNGIYEEFYNGVVESGSNENGSWVKFSDGTMSCSGRIPYLSLAINVSLQSLYCSDAQQITYPQTFVDVPSCTLDVEQNITSNNFVWITKSAGLGTNSKTPAFYVTAPSALTGTGTYGFYVSYTAVGRWK